MANFAAENTETMELKIVTGMSGAGKTQVVQVLEDLGYYCVDNLPPNLFLKFTELANQSQSNLKKIALVADIRGGKFFLDLQSALQILKEQGIAYEVIFLEANDEVLVRRFKETRRRHPLSDSGSILAGIQEERRLLEAIRGMADIIFDTSDLKVQAFKEQMLNTFQQGNSVTLSVNIFSFGFKYGIPIDSDLIMDVRFLPNPFYIEELKLQTGLNEAVRDYVLTKPVTMNFLAKYSELLIEILPMYMQEGKKHLAIGIGCTGGQHRSVAIACRLAEMLQQAAKDDTKLASINVQLRHRDVDKNKHI